MIKRSASEIDKKKLFIDVDGCIINTVKQIIRMYNKDFMLYKDFRPVNWIDINTWEFKECTFASKEIINSYFEQYRFFDDKLEFMDNAKEVITLLSEDYEIVACSMGFKNNLKYKREWLEKNLPWISQFIGVDMNIYKDKSHIDMSDAVAFIDDSVSNLNTSNCPQKILFGDLMEWNSDNKYGYPRCFNWYDVKRYLDKIK